MCKENRQVVQADQIVDLGSDAGVLDAPDTAAPCEDPGWW
jgi:hypothetical protein